MDRVELAAPHAGMNLADALAYLDRPPVGLSAGAKQQWARWPAVQDAHRIGLERAAAATAVPPGGLAGRGVVVGAGGSRYFGCAWAGLHVLRHVGSRLPVQWWYLGPAEIDPVMRRIAEDAGVQVIDTLEVGARFPQRILRGWEAKPFSVARSPFAEVLYLDADNVSVKNPESLFDATAYREHGAVFWPDLPPSYRREWVPKVVWYMAGMEPRSARAFESGQLLVDKMRCWRELSLVNWINAHSDYWYEAVYGDKDTFLLGWSKCDRAYAMTTKAAGWKWPAILQHDFDGSLLFQHACRGKPQLYAGHRIDCLVHADVAVAAGQRLRERWHGRIWDWADQTPEEMDLARQVFGRHLYRRVGFDERPLQLADGGVIPYGAAGCERRWSMRILNDVPTVAIAGEGASGNEVGMMFLTQSDDGVWRGRWTCHEEMPIELARASTTTTVEMPAAVSDSVAGRYRYVRIGIGERVLELFASGQVGDGRAGCEETWRVEVEGGVDTLIVSGRGRDTMRLRRSDDGVWRGRWLIHEAGAVELIP